MFARLRNRAIDEQTSICPRHATRAPLFSKNSEYRSSYSILTFYFSVFFRNELFVREQCNGISRFYARKQRLSSSIEAITSHVLRLLLPYFKICLIDISQKLPGYVSLLIFPSESSKIYKRYFTSSSTRLDSPSWPAGAFHFSILLYFIEEIEKRRERENALYSVPCNTPWVYRIRDV